MLNRKFVAAAALFGACVVSLGGTWPVANHLMTASEANKATRPFEENPNRYLQYSKYGDAGRGCGPCTSAATLAACVACVRSSPSNPGNMSEDAMKGFCVRRMPVCRK